MTPAAVGQGIGTYGMLADIVVLSEDIFEAPASRLASTRVTMTIFDGRIVYRRDGAQTD